MKTFEERYTAWIDGCLEGGALGAFEQELSRRAAAPEAQADKTDAGKLRLLLRQNLQAPALTNGEFFSLQIRERMDAERKVAHGAPETARRAPLLGWLTWPAMRIAGLGAACLFVVAALYYGAMPPRPGEPADSSAGHQVAANGTGVATDAQTVVAASPAPVVPPGKEFRRTQGNDLMARNDTPAPKAIDTAPDLAARVPDATASGATVTPIRDDAAGVNVLWVNGLEYMPDVPAPPQQQPTSAPAPASNEAPAAPVNPLPATPPLDSADAHHG